MIYLQMINGATAFPEPPSGSAGSVGGGWQLRGLGAH
jgi:hypothetical protein